MSVTAEEILVRIVTSAACSIRTACIGERGEGVDVGGTNSGRALIGTNGASNR